MRILFITNDLMFSSRAAAVAQRMGTQLQVFGQIDAAAAEASSADVGTVILDLTHNLDVADACRRLREAAANRSGLDACEVSEHPRTIRIVAYGPHVHVRRLHEARDAGCDAVLTRGEFDRSLERVLGSGMHE